MRRKNDPMDIDLGQWDEIALASSGRDGRDRWTVLSIWRSREPEPRYMAQIEALSDVEGERKKTRRSSPSANIKRALDFFDDSDLARTVIGAAEEAEANDRRRAALAGNKRWTDREALDRIFGEDSRLAHPRLLEKLFGSGASTTRAAIASGNPVKVPLAAIMPFLDMERVAAAQEVRTDG